jgi:isoleucyl-tRNA synthetase
VFRVVDDWFIAADEIRQPMLDANATVEWTPPQYGKRMDDWLRNMGDWNISRKRYFGLPLPFYECECGDLSVIGSRAELEARAVSGLDDLQELHRPWIDGVRIRCEQCGREVERVPEVGDAWLDAGIVNFSTLGWRNPEWKEHGYATGASAGLSGADLPDHAYWEDWFPADWVSENREQIRLWFYSQCFMAVTLDGRSPYRRVLTYEKVFDEHGKAMHKSAGNSIELNDALDRMGADVARWLYCAQPSNQPLRFGYALADEVKRRLLTFWNSVSFFVTYASIASFDATTASTAPQPLDGVRVVPGGPLELVHPPVTAPFLGRGSGRARSALRLPDAGSPRDRAGDAVSRRPPLAASRRPCRVGSPCSVARGCRRRRGAARRGRRRAACRRARTTGARRSTAQAPSAAAAARHRGCSARGDAC